MSGLAELADWSHSLWAKLMGAGLVFVALVLPAACAMTCGLPERVVLPLLAALVGPVLLGSAVPWAALRRRRWRGYEAIVERHRPQLDQFFARRGVRADEIAALIGAVFQRACQYGSRRRGEGPGPWLLKLGAQVFRDQLILETAAASRGMVGGAAGVPVIGSGAEEGEALSGLEEALQRLPEPMRVCVWLHYERGFSEREVAILTRNEPERAKDLLRRGAATLLQQVPLGSG